MERAMIDYCQTVEEVIKTYEFLGYEKFKAELLKWLLNTAYFEKGQRINVMSWENEIPGKLMDEFREEQCYDVIVFGDKHWLLYEAVDYRTARKACSAPCTRGKNWFLGFSIHGQFKTLEKAHKLECEKFLEDGCGECEGNYEKGGGE